MAEELCKLPSIEYALVSSPSMHGSQGSKIGIIIFIIFIDIARQNTEPRRSPSTVKDRHLRATVTFSFKEDLLQIQTWEIIVM